MCAPTNADANLAESTFAYPRMGRSSICIGSQLTCHPVRAIARGLRNNGHMDYKDISLLGALDILLNESSVAAAAEKMHLSPSAVSRILARIRAVTGDEILVQAGKGMVPTVFAESLRDQVHECVASAQALLERKPVFTPQYLERTFTLRATDCVASALGPKLFTHIAFEAPKVVLRFAPQKDESVSDLRSGEIDLDVGVISNSGPEIMRQVLFKDHFVAAVGRKHPLATGKITLSRFVRYPQISASRRGRLHGPLDIALEKAGGHRDVKVVVPGFADALCFARESDLIAIVPDLVTRHLRMGMHTFPLPVSTEEAVFSQAWHPRFQRDQAHQWFRECVRTVCAAQK